MSPKRRFIVCSAVAVAGLIAFMAGVGQGDGFTNPTVEPPRVADGETLYQTIGVLYPELVQNDFHTGTDDQDGVGPNVLQVPQSKWDDLDQAQQISLAQYLDAMGREWKIQVGEISSDGTKILSGRSVITSTEWHETLK